MAGVNWTSCQMKIHFSVKTTFYLRLLKYILFRFQIYVRAIVLITKHYHKIPTSSIRNNTRYNRLNTGEWISISTTLLSADRLKYEREITWTGKWRKLKKCSAMNTAKQPILSLDFGKFKYENHKNILWKRIADTGS